jgi:hypothetical protein
MKIKEDDQEGRPRDQELSLNFFVTLAVVVTVKDFSHFLMQLAFYFRLLLIGQITFFFE